jgi:phosphoserine phosphatase RsbU/P
VSAGLPFSPADPAFSQLRRLTEISRALTYTTSMEQVTRLTVERGAELLGAIATVLMVSDAQGLLHIRAVHGVAEEKLGRFGVPLGDDVLERLHGLLEVPDDRLVAVPLVVGGVVTGLVAAATRQPSSDADEALLSALADQAAVALEHSRLGGEVRLEMEARLRASEGATTAKDRALATLAHDIRAPLGAIEGYCELLEDEVYGAVTDRQREVLGRVRMSGRHLLGLLENVMDMTRLNAGALRLVQAPVPLFHVAREAVHMLTPAADAKLQVLHLGRSCKAIAIADHDRLRQVLVNLIGNAVKFTPEDGTIAVTVSEQTIDGEQMGEIEVSDSGPGISAEEQAVIFDPYYRSESVAGVPGVGLGLAISRGLMEEMGGALIVRSEPGAGSCFTVRLPIAP